MRILILDDDVLFAHMLAQQLERLMTGCFVASVDKADAARAAVRDAADPFDVLLLDVRLGGSDVDGVTLMAELKQTSPTSDAIVFTGYDVEDGLRAFDAGAYRYLTKPFDTRELVRILTVLQRERETRRQRDWLTILAEVAAQMQGTDDIHALADIIVRGGLRFEFRRARLRLFEQAGQEAISDPEMVGVSQAGEPRIDGFEGLRAPLSKLIYSQRAIEVGRPICFDGRQFGPGIHDEFYAAHGVAPPKGHWFKIPLFSGGHPVGALTLDNGQEERFFGEDVVKQLIQMLALFGGQAADALERARLHQEATRQAEEAALLSQIGRQVTAAATKAKGDLNVLLDEVRLQVARHMDVTNSMVVLTDPETGDLDFRRQYEQGELYQRHWRAAGEGLCGLVIASNSAQLIHDTARFCAEHGIRPYGPPAQCWLGVPLRVEGQAIGALAVQSYKDRKAYTVQHQQLLQKVADQVAGAIRLAYDGERQKELARQDQARQDLERVLPQLSQELDFWHAVLTTITHRDGNSFNRAALFWYNTTGEQMQGRMGVGYFHREDARRAWEEAERVNAQLSDYFASPQRARLHPTPLEQRIAQWRLDTGAPRGPCYQLWDQGERQVVSSAALRGCLPDELLQPPDLLDDATEYPCALLPMRAEGGVVGLLVVDNAFDGEPLRDGDLQKLEALLEMVMQRWLHAREADQTKHFGEAYEQALALSREVRSQAAGGQLKAALEQLCREAQQLTHADCVVVYPLHPSSGGYDPNLISHVGLRRPEEFQAAVKAKPRQHGVTFTVLRSGMLVVPDVARSDLSFAGRKLSEHAFLQPEREAIQALIAVPLRAAATSEPLGVLYLDYRSRQEFDQHDIALAEHLAAIGADALSYARAVERAGEGKAAAEAHEQRRQRDMQLLANIQMQALASDADEPKVVRSILQNAADLFGRPADVTLALLYWEAMGEENRQVRRDWRIDQRGRLYGRRTDPDKGPLGEVLRQGTIHRTGNALAIPILFGEKTLAALMVKRGGRRATFDAVDREVADGLATVAALALDSVRTRAHLQIVSQTVSAVSDPRGLEETLWAIVKGARRVGPDIGCVTLWYEERETGKLVAGPQWGVTQDKNKRENAQTDRLVRAVMNRQAPLFASVIARESILWGEFTRDEGIASVAAFPLRFGARQKALGALFLNYRTAHEFSPVERTLFPVFANAAATAIHIAQTLDLAERRRKRLVTALTVATRAGATLKEDNVVRGVLDVLRNEFRRSEDDTTAPYFMRYDERDRVLRLHDVAREFYQPDRPQYQHRVRLPLETKGRGEKIGITVRVARLALAKKRIVVENVPDVHRDPDYVEVNSKTQSELCAGLFSSERLLGALVIKSARLAAFDEDDKRLFTMAAQQVALALERLERAAKERRNDSIAGAVAWAADIAHDRNSRVGFIRNRAYWLLQREAGLSEQGKEWVQQIDQHATEIADMARDAGSGRSEPRTFVLDELLRDKLDEWRASRAVQVTLDVTTPSSCQVRAHPEQVWRAIRHLLRNAAEAMAEAGSSRGEIMVRLLPVGQEQIEVQVQDTGPGVSDEARRHLFRERFSTKAADVRGRGVGLLLAQWLIESLGGSIYLYPSAPGSGACVGIRLPLAHQEEQDD